MNMTFADYINSIKSKSIAILGLGVSNTPLAEELLLNGCDVTICDRRSFEELAEEGQKLLQIGAKFRLGDKYLENLREELVFRTPGLMPFEPHLLKAEAQGSTITSEMEVFFRLCPCQTIAVTGSDGKTTTTTIIAELLKANGFCVHLGGNIGHPLLCELPGFHRDDIAVLELSSFQLHSMYCVPDIALITNLSPNHLDKHLDFQDYVDSKANIFLNQTHDGRLILNRDDPYTPYYQSLSRSKLSYFSVGSDIFNGYLSRDNQVLRITEGNAEALFSTDEIRIPGTHNLQNFLAAFEAVRGLVSDDICQEVAKTFSGVAHRLETVAVVRGVRYINDSIATSPVRTIAGLHALNCRPIIICGGYDKHLPFEQLGNELCKMAKAVVLTGATAEKISEAIYTSNEYHSLEVRIAQDFSDAVFIAASLAVPGDTVLLSPACASFDHFHNFEERGNKFKNLVLELKK